MITRYQSNLVILYNPPVNLGVVLGCQDFIVLKRWPPGCQEWEALQNHNTQPLHQYKIRTMTHTKNLKSCKIRMHKTLLDMVFYTKCPLQNHSPTLSTSTISEKPKYKGHMVMKPHDFMGVKFEVSFMNPPDFMAVKFAVGFMKPPDFTVGPSIKKKPWHIVPIQSHDVPCRSRPLMPTRKRLGQASACHKRFFLGPSLACLNFFAWVN